MIHVCYGLRDESGKYSKFAGVSMQSILDNTQEKVTIHILHDSTLSEENYRKLALIALNHNQEIKFYNVETLAPDAIEFVQKNLPKINNFWGTIGALYRTLIPRFLDAERAIYLDTDVLVNLDIKDFWEVDLQSKPLGAVPECFSGDTHVTRIFGLCQNGTVDPHDYFNSGVLLMDLDRIRGGGASFRKLYQDARRKSKLSIHGSRRAQFSIRQQFFETPSKIQSYSRVDVGRES